ncbi:MAG: EamA family transporter, partial [Burkholderiales bacterium]
MKLLSLHPGIAAGLLAALLFGASAPLAKLLLARIDAWLLAGLLYLGSGIGLWLWRLLRAAPPVRLPWAERWWLVGAVVSGGLVGPVLLMLGLSQLTASRASLLLNAEALLTALLAWGLFRESVDRRVALGMLAIVAGGVVLVWAPTDASA